MMHDYKRNGTIRKVTPVGTNWVVRTLAGVAGSSGSANGTGSAARFSHPYGVAVDGAGNLYVADQDNYTIRKVTPAGVVTTLAGLAGSSGTNDGTGSAARFNYPQGVAVDSAGNVYVADTSNSTIRRVTPVGTTWVVRTLAGLSGHPSGPFHDSADGTGSAARFSNPSGVAVDSAGNVYVADSNNNTIRKGYPALAITSSGPGFGFNAGQFGFTLTGPSGQLVIVEASTDLSSWLPIWTNTFVTNALPFSDPQSGVHSQRFYRALLP